MIALQNWVVVLELELVTVVYASTLVCHYWRVVSFSSENASLLFFEQLWYFYGKISLSVRAKWTLCVFTETQLFFLGATIAQWIRLCFYLPPQVWFPSTPSMLLSFIVKFVVYLSLWRDERMKINKKTGFDPLKNIFFSAVHSKSLDQAKVFISQLNFYKQHLLVVGRIRAPNSFNGQFNTSFVLFRTFNNR